VDKNESIYTFRNELYRPEEFFLKKTDILFVAEKTIAELIAEKKIKNEVSFTLNEMIPLFGSFTSLFLAFVLSKIKRGNCRANRMLALFLIVEAIINTHFIYNGANDLFYKIPEFLDLHFIIFTLYAPLLYFYIVLLTRPGFIFKPVHLLHLALFFAVAVYFGRGTVMFSTEEKMLLRYYYIFNIRDFFMWNIYLIPSIIYVLLTFRVLANHKKRIKEEFSSTDGISLSWIIFMMYTLIAGHAALIAFYILDFVKGEYFFLFHVWPVINTTIIIVIGYKGLMQHEIFIDPRTVPLETPDVLGEKSSLPPERVREIIDKLTAVMDEKRPYLDPGLTLPVLADMTGVPRNYLSLAINEGMGLNFYDLVNSYRVLEIKKQLEDPDYQEINLLNLAFAAGFNSKATFNSVFKKNTGMTPTEFKKTILQKHVESPAIPAEDSV